MVLKYERRKRLMTQDDLARKSGISKGTICRLEKGRVEDSSVYVVLKVLDALNIKPSIFFSQYD